MEDEPKESSSLNEIKTFEDENGLEESHLGHSQKTLSIETQLFVTEKQEESTSDDNKKMCVEKFRKNHRKSLESIEIMQHIMGGDKKSRQKIGENDDSILSDKLPDVIFISLPADENTVVSSTNQPSIKEEDDKSLSSLESGDEGDEKHRSSREAYIELLEKSLEEERGAAIKMMNFYRSILNKHFNIDAEFDLSAHLSDNKNIVFNERIHSSKEEKHETEAMKWLRQSAEQDYLPAQVSIGLAYLNGQGINKNDKKAREWLKKAADKGDLSAQVHLGKIYFNGLDVLKDNRKAQEWFQKASDQGDSTAKVYLGLLWIEEKKYWKAKPLFEEAAKMNNSYGQVNLGVMYFNGDNGRKDYGEAIKWFKAAANQRNAYGQVNLGVMYLADYCMHSGKCVHGPCVQQDDKKALACFQQAADQENTIGQTYLGWMHFHGRGMEKDANEALKWFQRAAQKGDPVAQYHLYLIHGSGKSNGSEIAIEKDDSELIKHQYSRRNSKEKKEEKL